MSRESRRFPIISIVTLALVLATAGLLVWLVGAQNTVSADAPEQHNKIHGDFAFGFDGLNGTSLAVSRDDIGKNRTTILSYEAGLGNFGFGNIPNGDYKGSGNNHRLNTDISSVTGGLIVGLTSGPINATFVGNGGGTKTTGVQRFGFLSNMEVKNSGLIQSESATVSGTVAGIPINDPAGVIGNQRVNQKITHVNP